MALIIPEEFERGKREAAAFWRGQGEEVASDAFLSLEIGACRFGMDQHSRLAWCRVEEVEVGLRFDLETGEYQTSFIRRPKA